MGRVGRDGQLLPPGASHSPSARGKSACCFVSFPNSFPTRRKVRGALAGVSSEALGRETASWAPSRLVPRRAPKNRLGSGGGAGGEEG